MKLSFAVFAFCALITAGYATAQEAPDALVQRISQDVLDDAKVDEKMQNEDSQRVSELVQTKILPYIDFERMTNMAAGRHWRDATPTQRHQLTDEFRLLLVHTYSGAISKAKGQKLEVKPLHVDPGDTDVEVKSQVLQPRGEPLQVNYRMEKTPAGWKIYDVNIMGVWLIEAYKGNFSSEIEKGGVDGLIKTLANKNRRASGTGH